MPTYPVASVDSALRLLAMMKHGRAVTLTAAAEELGVAPSTAHRLLAMLEYHDFAVRDPVTKAYSPGPTLIEIAAATIALDPRELLRPVLEQLVGETQETAHLVRLDGADVRFVDSVESVQALRVTSRVGITMPAAVTAGGKALLAALPQERLESVLRRKPSAALAAELRRVRRRGYATNFGESETGIAAVGVAIATPGGPARLAFSVSAPQSRLAARRVPALAAAITRAARGAAESLSQQAS